MYTDFDFYTNTYFGDMIPEDSFEKFESKAADELDYITMNRIDDDMYSIYEVQINKAVCALAEVMYQIDNATKQANDKSMGGVIQSRSSGGESVTFASIPTVISAVLTDNNAQQRLMFDTVRRYLSNSGLLYQGV